MKLNYIYIYLSYTPNEDWKKFGKIINMTIELPEYTQIIRTLERGPHPYRHILPRLEESRIVDRIATAAMPIASIMDAARVRITEGEDFCFVDVDEPAVILFENYYHNGNPLDLYLDLVHELTHLRQHAEGKDLWNHELHYVDRPTEIEGFAVAVEEGIRLGMTEEQVIRHLSNPWLSPEEVARLRRNIDKFLQFRSCI